MTVGQISIQIFDQVLLTLHYYVTPDNEPWYDKECADLKAYLKDLKKKTKHANFPPEQVKFLHKIRNYYYTLIRIKENQYV